MQVEAAAGAERLARALEQGDVRVGVPVDGSPHVGELAVHVRAHGVEAGPVEGDAQDAVGGAVEPQVRELVVGVVGHAAVLHVRRCRSASGSTQGCSIRTPPSRGTARRCWRGSRRSRAALARGARRRRGPPRPRHRLAADRRLRASADPDPRAGGGADGADARSRSIRRGWRPASLHRRPGVPAFNEADLVLFEMLPLASELFGEDTLMAFTRVMGGSLARIAEAVDAMFLVDVEGPRRAEGISQLELARTIDDAVTLLLGVPDMFAPLFRRHAAAAIQRSRIARAGAERRPVRRRRPPPGRRGLRRPRRLHGARRAVTTRASWRPSSAGSSGPPPSGPWPPAPGS